MLACGVESPRDTQCTGEYQASPASEYRRGDGLIFNSSQPFQGQLFATIGAGPEGLLPPELLAGVDRSKDVSAPLENKQKLCVPSSYADENEAISNLLALTKLYNQDPVPYSLFPSGDSDAYNSNSFISGLLDAAGFALPASTGANTPGFNKPVPINRF